MRCKSTSSQWYNLLRHWTFILPAWSHWDFKPLFQGSAGQEAAILNLIKSCLIWMKFKVSNQTLNNYKQKNRRFFLGRVSGYRWDAEWRQRTTLTPSPSGVPSPSCRHANTHFNHLDFHYHGFLSSLLKPPLLTTESWTKINSLSCRRHQIAILVGFEFSFQTQTFDVCYIFSHTRSHKERKWLRLIRILSHKETRDGIRWTCCCEIRRKLQTGSGSQWQFHPDRKVQLQWSCGAGCLSRKTCA